MAHINATDKDKLLELVSADEAWLEAKQTEQLALTPFDKPAFESSELPVRMKPLLTLFTRVSKIPKPVPPAAPKVLYI